MTFNSKTSSLDLLPLIRGDLIRRAYDYGSRMHAEQRRHSGELYFTHPVERLEANDVRVHCLALGGVDLTSAAGKMTMQVIAAVAEFERDLLIERTQSGISRARAQGKRFGRPLVLNGEQRTRVLQRLVAGTPVAQVAKEFATSRQTIMRVRDAVNVHLHADNDERHSALGATSAPSLGLPASIA